MEHPNQEIEQIVENAIRIAQEYKHEFILVEHLLLALIRHEPFRVCLEKYGTKVDLLDAEISAYLSGLASISMSNNEVNPKKTQATERVFNKANVQAMFNGRRNITTADLYLSIAGETNSHAHYFLLKYNISKQEFIEFWAKHYKQGTSTISTEQANEVLNEHCINLTDLARNGKLEPMIGRGNELEEMITVLARRFKANVLVVGDPGIGKTAIVEGLAHEMVNNRVPTFLRDHELWSVEIGSLLAGCKYRGEFEEKFKVIVAALTAKKNCVLFIDEAHTMRGAGSSSQSGLDFANMLKPAITRGAFKVIASTTWEEFYSSFEKDRALMRRFYKLSVNEPTREVTKQILAGLTPRLEQFHGVVIPPECIEKAVELAERYIHDRKNPDKSIDIIDATCARQRIKDVSGVTITPIMVEEQVSKMTTIPKEKLQNERSIKVASLESNIKQKLYGQDQAVDQVLERVYVNFSGIGLTGKPMGSFLFLGPTGTGKTELAKLLAENLDMKLLRYDMSEYQERHTVSSLIGAPPGYVGFEDGNVGGGKLISDISKNPFSVLLFDEIEKAHPDVINIMLQMLDEGHITGANGKRVNCSNTIIIMTSNLGAQENETNNIGFGISLEKSGAEDSAMKNFFRPELRNRIDQVCKFDKLDILAIKKVVIKFTDVLKQSLMSKNIDLVLSEDLVEHLAKTGYDPKMGARPLSREIDKVLRVPLSKKILFENLANCTVFAQLINNEVTFNVKKTKKLQHSRAKKTNS